MHPEGLAYNSDKTNSVIANCNIYHYIKNNQLQSIYQQNQSIIKPILLSTMKTNEETNNPKAAQRQKELERQEKEKQEEEVKLQQKQQEDDAKAEAKRSAKKKQNAARKGKEEEEAKKKADDATKAMADETAASMGEDANDGATKKDVTRSPVKKKSRSGTKGNKKAPKGKGKKGDKSADKSDDKEAPLKSAWKKMKKKGGASKVQTTLFVGNLEAFNGVDPEKFLHKNKRTLIQFAMKLEGMDKFEMYGCRCQDLLELLQLVDGTVVFEPMVVGEVPKIYDKSQVKHECLTTLRKHIHTDADGRDFESKMFVNDKDGNLLDEPEEKLPIIYSYVYISSTIDTQRLLDEAKLQWYRDGGTMLRIDEFGVVNTLTAIIIMCVHNRQHQGVLMSELVSILEKARTYSQNNFLDENEAGINDIEDIPLMTLRLSTARLNGQDTNQFKGWSYRQQEMRKTFHVQCGAEDVLYLVFLHKIAKEQGYYEEVLGHHAFATTVPDKKESQAAFDRLIKKQKKSTNYNNSMKMITLDNISDIESEITFPDSSGDDVVVSMRNLLLNHVKTVGGQLLFQEVHGMKGRSGTDAVIANSKETDSLVDNINKNAAAWFYYYFISIGLPKEAVTTLMAAVGEPHELHTVEECDFHEETLTMTTKEEREGDDVDRELEKQPFWQEVASSKKKKTQQNYANAAFAFDVDAKSTTNTIHPENDNRYRGSPNAPVFDLGNNFKTPDKVDVDEDGTHVSGLTNVSKSAMAELLKKHGIKVPSKSDAKDQKTSPPDESSDEDSDESSDSDSSSDSEDSGSAVNSSMRLSDEEESLGSSDEMQKDEAGEGTSLG